MALSASLFALLALLPPHVPGRSAADTALRSRIEARILADSGADVAVAYVDLQRGDTLFLRADATYHAASTMKLPVLIELFQQMDAGRVRADGDLLLVNSFASIVDRSTYVLDRTDDSDDALYARVGTRVPVRELARRMMVRSSNLATNALIEVVGADRADATARRLGATHTRVLRGVEDGKAFQAGLNNVTTARDLAALLAAVERGTAASRASCDAMREQQLTQEFNDAIPAGLPTGTRVAHKTGNITAVAHDAAIVYPAGRGPYVLVVLTRGLAEQKRAHALIADVARLVHAHATS